MIIIFFGDFGRGRTKIQLKIVDQSEVLKLTQNKSKKAAFTYTSKTSDYGH
jgi:hypothetical protein